MMLMLFELFYVGFGQAIASFAPNELLASLLVPVFFLFVVSFCGIVVPYVALPYFWRSWMYWVSPFHYLLEGFLAVAAHDQPVVCSATEFARFSPPAGRTCQDYTREQTSAMGGYVQTGLDGLCELCAYKNGDEFAKGFNVYYSHIWRDFGIFIGFVVFNFAVVYLSTWLRFKGKNPLKGVFAGLMQKKKDWGKKDSEKEKNREVVA
jgi:ATP-binding cassette subfamily G (WHITE) protein 2 (SNQ2)